jgi:hypothetical protein
MPYFVVPKDISVETLAYVELRAPFARAIRIPYDWDSDKITETPIPARGYMTVQPCHHNCGSAVITVCRTREIAFRRTPDPKTHHSLFVLSRNERREWRNREQERFASGEYLPTPWHEWAYVHPEHFAHLSLKTPGMIAFTETEEKGFLDRQTVMKPGRYLETYYAGHFSKARVEQLIADCVSDLHTLRFASTADDIERVYRNGPTSCMSHSLEDYESTIHPVQVYGDSDLQVAYVGDMNRRVSGRAIVWPEKKLYSRIYGHECVMERLLKQAGYTSGSMRGAKVRAIYDDDNNLVMPYVDGISYGDLQGNWVVLGKAGNVSTSGTDGIGAHAVASTVACSRCDRELDEDDLDDGLCPRCQNDLTSCAECHDSLFMSDAAAETNNGHICNDCYPSVHVECASCGDEFFQCDLSSRQRRQRDAYGFSEYCVDCERTHVRCSECDTIYSTDDHEQCPDCEAPTEIPTPRCEHTADLFGDRVIGVLGAEDTPVPDGFYSLVHTHPESTTLQLCYLDVVDGTIPKAQSIGATCIDAMRDAQSRLSQLYPGYRYLIVQTPAPVTTGTIDPGRIL